jgi:hypothetical protein
MTDIAAFERGFLCFWLRNVASGNVRVEEAVENQAQRWFEKPFSCCIALQTTAFSSEQLYPRTRGDRAAWT